MEKITLELRVGRMVADNDLDYDFIYSIDFVDVFLYDCTEYILSSGL